MEAELNPNADFSTLMLISQKIGRCSDIPEKI
jgi:hypothetical protein